MRHRERPVRGADDPPPPVALTIAGSDSGGGAGIQADLKTFFAYGVFGTSALTAVTVQNTRGVEGIQKVLPEIVRGQILAVAGDFRPSAAKTGMLADAEIVRVVARSLGEARIPSLVLDPVMVAASGDPLLEPDAVTALRERLIPRATLLTPNLDEASLLLERPVRDREGMRAAAEELVELGADAVLMKGGHLEGPTVVDLYHDGTRWREWEAPPIETRSTHGTGCTLSAAIAAGLALGWPLEDAVDRGLSYTRHAIAAAPGLGSGRGPLNHWVPVPGLRLA